MTTKEEVLQNCRVEGLVVKLPEGQLERKLYMQVADALVLIGGKWKGGKVFGFEFKTDPTNLLAEIAGGAKRNLKKEFQFFGTPASLADYLVKLADIKPSDEACEPSAGQGAIVEAMLRANTNQHVRYCELMDINSLIMTEKFGKNPRIQFLIPDFLELNEKMYAFDKIVANPPFSKNQDIDHVMKMYSMLKPKGRIVTITSAHWQLSTNKKETQFREFLKKVNAHVEEIPKGSFKESGTAVGGLIIVIDK